MAHQNKDRLIDQVQKILADKFTGSEGGFGRKRHIDKRTGAEKDRIYNGPGKPKGGREKSSVYWLRGVCGAIGWILKQAQNNDKELLWNLLQKYLYEMTKYYSDDMEMDGNYIYRYFDAYFAEPERKACFIYDNEILVGFVMINPYSYLEHHPDNVIAEFTIFPSYRGKHIATRAAQKVLDVHPGKWEIKFNELNTGAKKLWETLTAQYNPTIYHLDDVETVLEFSNF